MSSASTGCWTPGSPSACPRAGAPGCTASSSGCRQAYGARSPSTSGKPSSIDRWSWTEIRGRSDRSLATPGESMGLRNRPRRSARSPLSGGRRGGGRDCRSSAADPPDRLRAQLSAMGWAKSGGWIPLPEDDVKWDVIGEPRALSAFGGTPYDDLVQRIELSPATRASRVRHAVP